MMKPTIVLIIAIAFTACKKEGLHSTWNVNGDGFSTDKVAEFSGKGGSGLGTDDKENGFTMNWGLAAYQVPGCIKFPLSKIITRHYLEFHLIIKVHIIFCQKLMATV